MKPKFPKIKKKHVRKKKSKDDFAPSVTNSTPASPESLLKTIRGKAQEVGTQRLLTMSRHEAYKNAKATLDSLSESLEKLCKDATEPLPLFETKPDGADGDLWKTYVISDLGLPRSVTDKLQEANIWTVGAIADFTKDGRQKLTDIPGVGEGVAEKIEKALDAFWERRKTAETEKHLSPEEKGEEADWNKNKDGEK